MKEKEITVLKVSPLEKPCRFKLKNNLDDLQRAVSLEAEHTGLIEIIEIGSELGYQDERVCLLCNEEGKLINLPPNRRVGRDVICGTFYITGQNKDGDLDSLSEEATQYYIKHFDKIEHLTSKDVDAAFFFKFKEY